MYDAGFTTREQRDEALRQPLALAGGHGALRSAAYFVEQVRRDLGERLGFNGLYELGLRIYTTLNVDAQRAAEEAIVSAVTQAYYGVLAAQEQVEVAEASIEAVAAELDLATERFARGAALKSDVLSLEVRLAAAEEAADDAAAFWIGEAAVTSRSSPASRSSP